MSPTKQLSSQARDRLLDQFLGDQGCRVYELHDKSIVALLKNKQPPGSILMAVLPEGRAQPNFIVYATKPSRILPNDDEQGAADLSPSFKPDYYLQRLKHATVLEGLAVADALGKLFQGFYEKGGPFEDLQEYLADHGIQVIKHDQPATFSDVDKKDLAAGYALFDGRQFMFHAGEAFHAENKLVSAMISCMTPRELIPSGWVIVNIGPTVDPEISFPPQTFNLKLRDSTGQEHEPDFSISDQLLTFTGLKEGETYTFIRAKS